MSTLFGNEVNVWYLSRDVHLHNVIAGLQLRCRCNLAAAAHSFRPGDLFITVYRYHLCFVRMFVANDYR